VATLSAIEELVSLDEKKPAGQAEQMRSAVVVDFWL
jgi:hypothetical protein